LDVMASSDVLGHYWIHFAAGDLFWRSYTKKECVF